MYNASNILTKARNNTVIINTNNHSNRYYRDVYLMSDHWKFLKEEKLLTNPRCELCGTSHTLDVHHTKYRSLYDVKLTDLKTLCRPCHDSTHEKISKKKNRKTKRFKIPSIREGKSYYKLHDMVFNRRLDYRVIQWVIRHLLFELREENNRRTNSFTNYISIHY